MVQLFWGCCFDYVFIPFETSNFDPFLVQKLYDLDDLSPLDMLNQIVGLPRKVAVEFHQIVHQSDT